MKKIFLVAAVAASAVALSSCGSSKDAGYYPSYQQQVINQTQKMVADAENFLSAPDHGVQKSNTTKSTSYAHDRKEEVKDPWYELQSQATDRLRGAGDAINSIKMVAVEMAKTQAAGDLANQIEQAVSSARKMVMSSYQLNDKVEASTQFASKIKTMAQQLIGFNRPLMTKTYTLKDGSYQVGYCFEMIMTISELMDKMANAVVDDIYNNHPGMPESEKAKVKDMTVDATNFLNED